MRYFFSLVVCLLLLPACAHLARAQNYPVYNAFYLNPYLYNPAEAVAENAYVNFLHRQQWMGIDGAPVVTGISYNTLVDETRVGLGARLSSYKRGLLNTNDVSLSYAYSFPLDMDQKNWLIFGMSGGVMTNTIDLSKVSDPDDPAIVNYLANNIQPTANFGMLFKTSAGLNLGIALPQLFAPRFNSLSHFESTAVSPLDNVFVTAYFKRHIEKKVVNKHRRGMKARVRTEKTLAPLELYVTYKYAALGNSQLEFMGKLNLSDYVWIGGSYRLPYGFTANAGINFNRFLFSYSFEPGTQPEAGFSTGTHEVMLGVRVGSQKNFKRATPVLRSTIMKGKADQHTARFQTTTENPDDIAASNQEESLKKRYYVVIQAFSDFAQADAFKRKLIDQKYNANIYYYAKERKYLVHVFETGRAGEAHEEARNLKAYTKLRTARVVIVVTSEK